MANTKVQHTGIMNKMRDKMPLIIIILIIAFLATIVFEWGMNYMGLSGQSQAFAKINSQEISYQEFERIVQQQIEQMRQQNQGKDVDEAMVSQIREQVWSSLVSQTLTKQAIEEYGIKVSDKEILDWIYNRPETLPEPIKKSFMDSTGVFNAAFYQQALTMKTKEASQFWNQVENFLRETLLSEKLQAILTESAVVSEGDVLEKYKDENIKANLNYAFFDLNSITDTNQFAVNENDLKKYYDDHKSEFKQNESVKLKYVTFPDAATAEDSAAVKKQMERLQKEMKTAEIEDSSLIKLVNENSTVPFNPDFQKPGAFEPAVISFLFKAQPGDISEVIGGQSGYQVVKLLEVKDSGDVNVSASHILINFGVDTAASKSKAQQLLDRVKKGEDINTLAFELSEDPSAKQNRGNLGWFAKGSMVKEFEDAVFNAKVGDIAGPIQTNYGFHVIKVEGKENKQFKAAQITKTVQPSSRSKQLVKNKAEEFYSDLEKGQIMDSLAKQMNLQVQTTPEVSKDGPIPGAGQNKNLLKFVFDNDVNSVSEPVKIPNGYSIYQIIQKNPKGYYNFDSIKTTLIKPKVMSEKKFQILLGIANDLEGKIKDGDLNSLKEVAPQYVYEAADTFSVAQPDQLIGQDYALSEAIFKLKPGEISKPIKGVKGYYIVKLNSLTEFSEEDYLAKATDIKNNLLTAKRQQIISDWLSKVQSEAEIVDNRDKYF